MICRLRHRLRRRRLFSSITILLGLLFLWILFGTPISYDDNDFPDGVEYDVFVDETKDDHDHDHVPLDVELLDDLKKSEFLQKKSVDTSDNDYEPIILWWTHFTGEPGKSRQCGNRKCFFTNDRKYRNSKNMKVFVFYGTDFKPEDLPLPRESFHEWALLHEESPKNNYLLSHEDALNLFNHTSTFRQESDFPISTQHIVSLDWLEQKKYMQSVEEKNKKQQEEGLASVVYVQTDCDPPSDRDVYVKKLMKLLPIDSYGQCLKNKKLPEKIANPVEGMAHKDFYQLLSGYKFSLAMENAVCLDYMTEKLWRPLMVGTVPVIFGSPRVKDFLPNNHSGVVISDFPSVEELASRLLQLNRQNDQYEKLRKWKSAGVTNNKLRQILSSRTWSPDDLEHWYPGHINFVEAFECHICQRLHEDHDRELQGYPPLPHWATQNHYGCPKPMKFDDNGRYEKEASWTDFWPSEWQRQKQIATALLACVQQKSKQCAHVNNVMMMNMKKDF